MQFLYPIRIDQCVLHSVFINDVNVNAYWQRSLSKKDLLSAWKCGQVITRTLVILLFSPEERVFPVGRSRVAHDIRGDGAGTSLRIEREEKKSMKSMGGMRHWNSASRCKSK
jgi:hypothetical protein